MNQVKTKVLKAKTKKVLNVLITYCILIVVAFIFLFPCLWLILASFSKSGSIYSFDGFSQRIWVGCFQIFVYGYSNVQLSKMVF